MRSVGSHSTAGREKEEKKEKTGIRSPMFAELSDE
jgi:hypothetical protein